jgi:hypothetical protein
MKDTKSKAFDKDFMNDFVNDLKDYHNLIQIEEHRLKAYRQIWELVSYSLSIEKFSLIYTNKEEKLVLDISSMFAKYKICSEDKKAILKLSQLNVNHQRPIHDLSKIKPEVVRRNNMDMDGRHTKHNEIDDINDSMDDIIDEYDIGDEMVNKPIQETKAINKPNTSSFIGAAKNNNFTQNHKNMQRPRFASGGRAVPETMQNSTRSPSPFVSPSSTLLLSITSPHSEAISIEIGENFSSRSLTKYVQIGHIMLKTNTQSVNLIVDIFENMNSGINQRKPNFTMDALEFITNREIVSKLVHKPGDENIKEPLNRADKEYDRIFDIFVKKLDQSLFGEFDLFLQFDVKQGRFELCHGD